MFSVIVPARSPSVADGVGCIAFTAVVSVWFPRAYFLWHFESAAVGVGCIGKTACRAGRPVFLPLMCTVFVFDAVGVATIARNFQRTWLPTSNNK